MSGAIRPLHSAQDKWCPEEGEFVARMLLKRCSDYQGSPDIFVISPFRRVADNMKQRMHLEEQKLYKCGIKNPNEWIKNSIGTIHTFQGQETKAVILLLGAPCPKQDRARVWVTKSINLLNVAVSRAKQNFYIVGNHDLWNIGSMRIFTRNISIHK